MNATGRQAYVRKMNESKFFSKDFILVIIGQIISLFGNQVLRFALPLYLLKQTDSAALFGAILACSFIPMIVLCPIGGIIADRVNKRNIMVILDFSTALITLVLSILLGKVDVVMLLLVTMILLYGIQGAYQPAVQASIPALVTPDKIMQGNAMINLVSSLAGLIGPVIGGALFGFFGIMPILQICIGCFLFSAIMEIFIKIPFTKQESKGNIFAIGFGDIKDSFHYITHDQPDVWKVSLVVAAINMFFSALIIIGLPIIITKTLGFSEKLGNQLYGYSEGAIAAGCLIGGLLVGVIGRKIKARYSTVILLLCTLTLIPIGIVLQFKVTAMTAYVVIIICCLVMMTLASMFSIQMMSYLQIITPETMIGKVISCAMCIGMCAQPLGQAIYGGLFQLLKNYQYIPFYMAVIIVGGICIATRGVFVRLEKLMEKH